MKERLLLIFVKLTPLPQIATAELKWLHSTGQCNQHAERRGRGKKGSIGEEGQLGVADFQRC